MGLRSSDESGTWGYEEMGAKINEIKSLQTRLSSAISERDRYLDTALSFYRFMRTWHVLSPRSCACGLAGRDHCSTHIGDDLIAASAYLDEAGK